jgi:hypothetical protein
MVIAAYQEVHEHVLDISQDRISIWRTSGGWSLESALWHRPVDSNAGGLQHNPQNRVVIPAVVLVAQTCPHHTS